MNQYALFVHFGFIHVGVLTKEQDRLCGLVLIECMSVTLSSFMSESTLFSLPLSFFQSALTFIITFRVYSSGSKYMKDPDFFQTSGGIPEALPLIVDVEYHRRRRKLVNNLFSVKSMEALSHIVLGVVHNALRKTREHHDAGKPLDIQRLYTGITIDTIMKVLCDRSLNLIDAKEEEPPFLATLRTFSENFFLLKHFPILIWLGQNIPLFIAEKLIPGEFEFRKVSRYPFQSDISQKTNPTAQEINQWISQRAKEHDMGIVKAEDGRKTVIDLLLRPEDDGPALTHHSIEDETYSFAFAGTHTTSHTMSMGTYYLLRNPSKVEKLKIELQSVPRNENGLLEYRQVRDLPYLVSVPARYYSEEWLEGW